MTDPEKFTVQVRGGSHESRLAILEHVINPALKDYGVTVEWPDYPATDFATITVGADELSNIRDPR